MKLSSSVFRHEGKIPSKYTCDGENSSPHLIISDVPAGAKSLVLIMDDPDVPKNLRKDGLRVHALGRLQHPSVNQRDPRRPGA